MKNVLSPKDLGTAIGVSESSLKRWADDGRLHVARTAGGHRRIQLTEAVRFIRDNGFAVQRPDLLGFDELACVDDQSPGNEDLAEQFHQALLAGRAEEARGIALALFLKGVPLAQVLDRIMAPAVAQIGDLWKHAPEGIFTEHRATEICINALNRIRGVMPATTAAHPVAIGGAPEDDAHGLSSLMAATVLASEGWTEINLGAHTPSRVLADAAVQCEARLVWCALSTPRAPGGSADVVSQLVADLHAAGSTAALVVGGHGLEDARESQLGNASLSTSMSALAAFARGLRSAPPYTRPTGS
jgi:methanogenic corrinoid protein MtbC1